MKPLQFIKDWTLIVAIVSGIVGYFVYVNIPFLQPTHALANKVVAIVQPSLIFVMLFFTYCRVDLRQMRLCRWHIWLALIQTGSFIILALILMHIQNTSLRVVIEGAMICLICPTATAAAVVTRKLGGDVSRVTSYTILINVLTAVVVPVFVPLIYTDSGVGFTSSALLILGKVMPLLLAPLLLAILMRAVAPRLVSSIARYSELSFYLWAIALTISLSVTTRSIVHSTVGIDAMIWLVFVSIACCVIQFVVGQRIGARYSDKITAGQALGQKNTILAIWMGYTFFTPVTAMAGGFYSIWHNLVNTWQLYRQRGQH